jgi:hypothetical protein
MSVDLTDWLTTHQNEGSCFEKRSNRGRHSHLASLVHNNDVEGVLRQQRGVHTECCATHLCHATATGYVASLTKKDTTSLTKGCGITN